MIEECRARFPELAILSGVEISEPHWHKDAPVAELSGSPRLSTGRSVGIALEALGTRRRLAAAVVMAGELGP